MLLPPLVFDLALWCAYLASYRGTCGPHPTDIPEHACSYATYSAEFWGGFDGIGLILCDIAMAFAASILVCTFWTAAGIATLLDRSRSHAQAG